MDHYIDYRGSSHCGHMWPHTLHLHCVCIAFALQRRSAGARNSGPAGFAARCMWPTTGLRGCGATGYAVCVHTISVIFNRPVTIKSDDPAGRTPYGGRPTLSPGSPHRAPAKNGLRGVRPPKRRSLRHLNAASPQRVTRIPSFVTRIPAARNTNATVRNTHLPLQTAVLSNRDYPRYLLVRELYPVQIESGREVPARHSV